MAEVKVLVAYYSATGTLYQMARAASEAATSAGAEVRLCKAHELAPESAIDSNPAWRKNVEVSRDIREVELADLEWADAYLFGSPTRYGNMAAQLRQFMDSTGGLWQTGKLANKVVSCFTSSHNTHGGQESTLLSMYSSMYHWGCFIVPPGYTDPSIFAAGGNPYGTSCNGTYGEPLAPEIVAAISYQARRVVQVTGWLVAGRNAGIERTDAK